MAEITKEQIIEAIEKMTVMELNELVKALEEKFDVQAMAPMAAVAAAPAAGGAGAEEAEKTEFDVILKEPGERKIPVIKLVKDLLGIDLKKAKELVDNAPSKIKEKVSKDEADKIKAQLEEAGALVEVD